MNLFKIFWQKAFFIEYLNEDGVVIISDNTLFGEIQIFNDLEYTKNNIKYAIVSCDNGKMYFVPYECLTFIDELN